MFNLDKILNIIKENDKEVFLAREDKELVVLMSLNRYRQLIKKNKSAQNNTFINNPVEIRREDYPDQVKEIIMPEIGSDTV